MDSSQPPPKIKPALTALALLITEANAPALTGWSFRYCCEVAQRRGVPILRVSSKKFAIRADAFMASLERSNITSGDAHGELPAIVDCGDPAEAVRRMLGKKRAGAR